jgi:hypothetical protein
MAAAPAPIPVLRNTRRFIDLSPLGRTSSSVAPHRTETPQKVQSVVSMSVVGRIGPAYGNFSRNNSVI